MNTKGRITKLLLPFEHTGARLVKALQTHQQVIQEILATELSLFNFSVDTSRNKVMNISSIAIFMLGCHYMVSHFHVAEKNQKRHNI